MKGIRESQQYCDSRQHHPPLKIADEGDARRALLRDLSLSQSPLGADLPDVGTEDLALFSRFRGHESTSLT